MAANPNLFITPEGILSFPALFEKKPVSKAPGADLAYSCKLILNTGADTTFIDKVIAHIQKTDPKASGLNFKHPKMYKAWKSNMEEVDMEGNRRAGFEDDNGINITFRQKKTKPQILQLGEDGKTLSHVINEEEVYAGNIVRVSFMPFLWVRSDGFGISFSLMNVLKTGEGERIAGAVHTDAANDFSAYGTMESSEFDPMA